MQIALKYIVLTQTFIAVWAQYTPMELFGHSFSIMNLVVTGFGTWAMIDKLNIDAAQVYLISWLFSLVTDVICVGNWASVEHLTQSGGTGFAYGSDASVRFALAMAILLIFLKVGFAYFIWADYQLRSHAGVDGSAHAPLTGGAQYDSGVPRPYDPLHAADPLAHQHAAAHAAGGVPGGMQAGAPVQGYAGVPQAVPPASAPAPAQPTGGYQNPF